MRHRNSGRKLNRTDSHRRAMFRNMTASLVTREIIRTTLPKAKSLRSFAEPLITRALRDTVANRRLVFSRLRSHEAVGKLFTELGERYRERPGGYLRILRDGFRPGDKAPMAWVELVDRPGYESLVDEATRQEQNARRAAARAQAAEEKARQEAIEAEKAATEEEGAAALGKTEVPEETAPAAADPVPTPSPVASEEAPAKASKEAIPEERATEPPGEESPAAPSAEQKKGLGSTLAKPFKALARLLRRD